MTAPWPIDRMPGFRISHTMIVRNPACPTSAHSMRECGCKVFRVASEAKSYAELRSTK